MNPVSDVRPAKADSPYGDILGATPRMQRLFRLIQRVAVSESTVLITGESGTGKELVARSIHLQSSRSTRSFIPVNCGAIPEDLIESELFGYARGAFTGATTMHRGLIEEADGGTLFLDEVAELPTNTQVKLLRFLESNEVRRLGENEIRIVDTRVIAATHRKLDEEIARGKFRKDLFFRLNIVLLDIPPLRERKEDLPLLSGYFLERYSKKIGKVIRGFSPEAQAHLMRYDYPGNVRELENAIQRAVTLTDSEIISPTDLPPTLSQSHMLSGGASSEGGREHWSLEEVERDHIVRVLDRHDGNLVHTSAQLGISRTTLWRKMKRYGIEKTRS